MMEVRKQLGLLLYVLFIVSLAECVKKETRRWKREVCDNGSYTTSDGKECCLCSAGHYLEKDCVENMTPASCSPCGPETYIDYPNSETRCVSCRVCESNANLDEKERCMPTSNRRCTCKDGFYCDKETCKVCHACDTCVGLRVKTECSATNNTVCMESRSRVGAIIGGVFGAIAVIGVIVLLVIRCRKKPNEGKASCVMEPLQDIDLSKFLHDIAKVMGKKSALNMARRVLSQVEIENLDDQYRHDVNEMSFQLLNAWYEKHGLRGAYSDLINCLRSDGKNTTADKVQNLISRRQQANAEKEGNSVV